MGRVETLPRILQQADAQARVLLVAAFALVGVAAWLVIARHPRIAGAVTLGSAGALVFGAIRAQRAADRLLWFLDSLIDRVFDGALLAAIAVAMRHADHWVAGFAVGTLGVSFVAAYERAKGKALGYRVRDSLLLRTGRYLAIAAGLLADGLLGALVAVLALVTFTAIDDARQVAWQGA
jgi:hypothetical protein